MLSDSVPPYYTDGPIRKKSHGSEELLRTYDYQLEGSSEKRNLEEGSCNFPRYFTSHVCAQVRRRQFERE